MTVVLDATKIKKQAAPKPAPLDVRPSLVRVNGVTIARDAIQREMQHHAAEKPIAAWQQAARALAIRELLLQEARRLAIAPEPLDDGKGRRETDEEAIIRGLLEREARVPEPDNETCQHYFEQNRARFCSLDIYEASHILFAAVPSDRDAYEQARADADGVLAALAERPESFSVLARAYSRCPSATQGGNLGQVTEGQTTPEFEQVLMTLKPGQLCGTPVETRYGFHIVRLDRKIAGRPLPYEAVAEQIAEYLRENVRRRAHVQYVARLVSAARIEGVELADADRFRVH